MPDKSFDKDLRTSQVSYRAIFIFLYRTRAPFDEIYLIKVLFWMGFLPLGGKERIEDEQREWTGLTLRCSLAKINFVPKLSIYIYFWSGKGKQWKGCYWPAWCTYQVRSCEGGIAPLTLSQHHTRVADDLNVQQQRVVCCHRGCYWAWPQIENRIIEKKKGGE